MEPIACYGETLGMFLGHAQFMHTGMPSGFSGHGTLHVGWAFHPTHSSAGKNGNWFSMLCQVLSVFTQAPECLEITAFKCDVLSRHII